MSRLHKGAVILEGITHIEDLPLEKFIDTVEHLKSKIATEKLDGANLWFGVDEQGFFTSREGKSKNNARFYSVDDYAMVANYNGFRSAHLAFEQVKGTILKVLQPGDIVEVEVLFGRQPNTVTYGVNDTNFIVILRGIGVDVEKVNRIASKLNDTSVTVTSTIINSEDGEKLDYNQESQNWQFTQVRPVDSSKINTADAMMKLGELKKYLEQTNQAFPKMTNKEVAEVKLGSIEKSERVAMKAERELVLETIMTQYKMPIKEALLNNYVRKIKPQLQADNLDPSEDVGVEGVVLRDQGTDEQVKLVDKDVFTAMNKFNNTIRSTIAGVVRTDDQDAPIEMRGGAFGEAKIRIAQLLGMKELAISSSGKRTLAKFKGATPEETATNVANSANIHSLPATRSKVSSILQNAIEEIDKILEKFKAEADTYKLKLKTGKEIGISPEVMKRTLTAFAETKLDINKVDQAIDKAETPAQLVMSLYGRTIQSLFNEGDKVKESFSLLKQLSENDADIPAGHPVAVPDSKSQTTTANAIQPNLNTIGSMNIVKRKRNFVMKKKFAKPTNESILRLVEFDVMNKNATDVDDKFSAQNDIEFKQLRNNATLGQDVTDSDVTRYLNKAHELNDEVDTVTFGMEMDDGSIVKVYVNATQADGFEAALAQLLGEVDDVEEAINQLALTYDIVDVEWPEAYQGTADQPIAVDAGTLPTNSAIEIDANSDPSPTVNPIIDLGDIESNDDDNPSPNEEGEDSDETTTDSGIDTTFFSDGDDDNDGMPDDDEQQSDSSTEIDIDSQDATASDDSVVDVPIDDAGDNEDEPSADDIIGGEEATDDTTPPEGDEDESPEDGNDEEEPQPEPGTDEEDEESEEDTDKPKKKEESVMTFGQQFKQKLLAEKVAPKKKVDQPEDEELNVVGLPADVTKLLQSFPNRGSKAMVILLHLLGAPTEAMALKKSDVRKSVEFGAEKYLKDSQFRVWVKRLTEELQKVNQAPAEAALADELGNAMQKMILEVMQKIGLPESVERLGRAVLRTAIRNTAKLALSNAKIRQYLKVIAEQLGIDAVTGDLKEAVKNIQYKIEIPETATKLRALSAREKEDHIFGEEEDDPSFIQNQTVATVDHIKVKGNTIYVIPIIDLEPEDVSIGQPKLQKAFDRWCASFERREPVDEAAQVQASSGKAAPTEEVTGNEWVDEIMALVASLGIPEQVLNYRRKQTELAVKTNRQQMQNYALVLRNVKRLNQLIGGNKK